MAGWAFFSTIALLAFSGLWRLRFARALRIFALAAIMLAAAGYAWQGHPGWAGRPAHPAISNITDDETIALRSAMFGRYGADAMYYTPADAMVRVGATRAAAQFLQAGIDKHPDSVGLWTQLGTVLADNDHAVSPAAAFAFRRATALNLADPAPWFFLGQAQARAGDFLAAKASWQRALALTPSTFSYRPAIVERLAMIDLFLQRR